MTLRRFLSASALFSVIGLAVASSASAQRPCFNALDIVDVPTPGYLRTTTPQLILEFQQLPAPIPVTVVSKTTSRMRIQLPATGLLSDARFQIRHISLTGNRTVANGWTCPIGAGGDPGGGAGGGGGSGSGSGGGSAGGSSGGSSASTNSADIDGGTSAARARLVPATRFDVVAPSGAPEFMIVGSARDVSRAEAVVLRFGGDVLRRQLLPSLGLGTVAVDLRGLVSLVQLRGEFNRLGIDVGTGRHNVYRLTAGDAGLARQLVFGAQASPCRLNRSVRVGLIDGPVNSNHPALAGVSLETATVLNRRDRSAAPDHGTGLAGLIAAPEFGLAPGSTLFAVTAVSRVGAREVAKLEDIAAALDWMVSRRVDVVNMSLAGPSNRALARAIERAADAGIILVAAVGNDRRARVAYPASDKHVIAVTAIDAEKRLYRHASRGDEVDFAAPGVDLRVPTANRMAFRSGTSYASAAVTALIATELSKGKTFSADDIRRRLAASAEDLGPEGRDTGFGFGLARIPGC